MSQGLYYNNWSFAYTYLKYSMLTKLRSISGHFNRKFQLYSFSFHRFAAHFMCNIILHIKYIMYRKHYGMLNFRIGLCMSLSIRYFMVRNFVNLQRFPAKCSVFPGPYIKYNIMPSQVHRI